MLNFILTDFLLIKLIMSCNDNLCSLPVVYIHTVLHHVIDQGWSWTLQEGRSPETGLPSMELDVMAA